MTLNDAANLTKKALAYFVVFLVLYLIGEYLIKGSNYIYNRVFPMPNDPPTVSFGKIEIVDIPTLPIDLSSAEYRKELPISGFPNIPASVRVYEVEQPIISVQKEENFKEIAKELGFNMQPIKVSDTERKWRDIINRREFNANVFYETFDMQTESGYLERVLQRGNTVSKSEAVDMARDFFSTTGVLKGDLDLAEYTVEGVRIVEGVRKSTPLPTEEYLKFVNVVPKKISHTTIENYDRQGKPIYKDHYAKVFGANPVVSNVNAFVANFDRQKSTVTDGLYTYYNTTGNYGTYPVISPQKAWDLLATNKASLVFIREDGADFFAPSSSVDNISTIDIRSMEIAYYSPSKIVDYIQPIYIFTGKYTTQGRTTGDVVFYLSALDPVVDRPN